MAHSHPMYDTDTHFIIDPITRAVTNAESKKTLLMQFDHNSERFTFELARNVEGHDMLLCNRVEVHYTNVDSNTKEKQLGVYEVDDFEQDPNDETKVIFSWVVSGNATTYAGPLNFLIVFSCFENDETTYRWQTNINNSITIAKGMNNGDAIEKLYPDILAQWKEEISSRTLGYEAALANGFEGSLDEWLLTLRGEPGGGYMTVGNTEPLGPPYIWFDTTGYETEWEDK